ncbi:MAG: hypothetical protein IPP31_12645 [Chitinophagaceae bacterium]|nr:hypothetical protein [Chitinophagaceae bacterium]
MIEYQENGKPTVLNYNVPEPTAYRGRNLIRMEYPESYFKIIKGKTITAPKPEDLDKYISTSDFMVKGPVAYNPALASKKVTKDLPTAKTAKASTSGDPLPMSVVKDKTKAGSIPTLVPSVNGIPKLVFATSPEKVKPGIYIVETYKLSNFLGDYGAGRVINTFSLLPGEKTTISVKSYRSSTTKATSASSIFDSYTTETEDNFEDAVQSENSNSQLEEETFNYHAEAEAEAKWGWGSAKVSGGVSGSTNSSRETFAKNMSSSTNKHANKSSAQRDIQINTSSESTTTEGEETVIERQIENINISRTLNFIFRQMNQQFISILHLVDVKVGFYNGYPDTLMEVPLYELDTLLDYCIAKPEYAAKIKKDIIFALSNIIDYKGVVNSDMITKKIFTEADNTKTEFYAVNRNKFSLYEPAQKTVEGIILSVDTNVLRTDGVIVEALLGQCEALGDISRTEKEEYIELKSMANASVSLQNSLMSLYLEALKTKNTALSAEILKYYEIINAANPAAENA